MSEPTSQYGISPPASQYDTAASIVAQIEAQFPYVTLAPGYFYLDSILTLNAGISVKGAGSGKTVLVAAAGTDEAVLMSGAKAHLEGVSIVRLTTAGGNAGRAVSVTGADCTLVDVECDGLAGALTTGVIISSAGDRAILKDVVGLVTDAGDVPTAGGIVAKVFSFINPLAIGTNDIHALYDNVNTGSVTTGFTQPDMPRNLVCVKATSWDGGTVTVVGTDQYDRAVSETFPALGAGSETGTKIFKTVTSMSHSIALAGGNGFSLGSGGILGVKGKLVSATDYVACQVGAAVEAATLGLVYDTVTFTTALDGSADFVLLANVREY